MSLPASPVQPAQPIQIEILPAHPGLPEGAQSTEIDVLVRVTASETTTPVSSGPAQRPPLNLALVLDRSGSMGGEKMEFARQAAAFAVDQLRADDRVSVIAFDSEVEVPVPSTPAADKALLKERIRRINTRGSTALHGGWVEGGAQVGAHLRNDQLNRVILFTDGQANVGETRPEAITADVRGLAQRGISTTTLGIGLDYNEDLLEAIARAGDGNYYFIESPSQLASLFASELRGLLATVGRAVSLGLEPGAGVEVLEVYNDLERNSHGRLMLPNLAIGQPVEVVLRLRVPAGFAVAGPVCGFRLAWDDPKTGERRELRQALTMSAMSAAEFEALPTLPEVAVAVALLQAAREKRRAVDAIERGDMHSAQVHLQATQACMAPLPACPAAMAESADVQALQSQLAAGEVGAIAKRAKEQIYRMVRSRGRK